MKRCLILLLLCFIYSNYSFGQNDHLEPQQNFLNYQGELKEYYDNVFAKLLNGLSKKPLARYLVLPSFSSEYVLCLEKDVTDEKHYLKLRYLTTNYWYAKSKRQVRTNTNRREISDLLAYSFRNLLEAATNGIKEPEQETQGLDGETYLFSYYKEGKGLITGGKWSPDKGTEMEQLINLCEQYLSFVKGKGKNEQELINQTEPLIKQLKY